MSLPSTNQHLTAQPGGTQPEPHWVKMLEINARAQADAEVLNRRYIQSPKQTQGLNYDDRLHIRLGCGKTKAYELLNAYTNGEEGGLRHVRVGNKYIVTEQAVREWFGDYGMQASTSKAA
ncbi:hypothetical protein [Hymenobacter cellulosivorans]|uniref:DNA-binding protein n=1 Tax=Hymenobacter cellulosivorans TaxID=2932249 RepID=A0ABY4FAQ0_9BACT|nr:hypothetical protein [Hymenobacter cellulosivorans]UOQ53088.1 hypothetical protein MUN80_25540 [Hymenobacter cellulosivorans]